MSPSNILKFMGELMEELILIPSAVFILPFIVLLLFGFYKGFRRGILRQGIRTSTILISILLCFYMLSIFVGAVDEMLSDKTTAQALENIETIVNEDVSLSGEKVDMSVSALTGLSPDDPEEADIIEEISNTDVTVVRDFILVVAATFIFPIVFTILFVVISFIFEIIYGIICLIFRLSKQGHSKKCRWAGGLLGLVQGFIVATIIFLPFGNAYEVVYKTVDIAGDYAGNKNEFHQDAYDLVTQYNENKDALYPPVMRVTNALGGRAIAKSISTISVNGEDYDSRDCLVSIVDILCKYDALIIQEPDFANLTASQNDQVRHLANSFLDDHFISSVFTKFVHIGATYAGLGLEWENDDSTEYNAAEDFYSSMISIAKDTSVENLKTDVNLLVDIYFLLHDEGAIKAFSDENEDALIDAMTRADENGKTVIRRVLDSLYANPRTKPIVNYLSKISIALMMNFRNHDDMSFDNIEEVYAEVKLGMEDINKIDANLSDKAYTGEVSKVIVSTLEKNEISLDDVIIDNMSNYVTENYKGKELTDDDINDIIFNYYDAYIEYENSKK